MTTEEEKALSTLQHNVGKLIELIELQTLKLQHQATEIQRLRSELSQLQAELEVCRERSQMVEVAQGFSGDNLGRERALSYLDSIIVEVKQCLKQLEQV